MSKERRFLSAAAIVAGLMQPLAPIKPALAESGNKPVSVLVCKDLARDEKGIDSTIVYGFENTTNLEKHIRIDAGTYHGIFYKGKKREWDSDTRKGIEGNMNSLERGMVTDLQELPLTLHCYSKNEGEKYFRGPDNVKFEHVIQ